jgi:hypothetical protein
MKMKNKFLLFGLVTQTFILSCADNEKYVGAYSGILVMEDGTHNVGISLDKSGTAILSGFHETEIQGEWENEKVGELKNEGVWASFDFPNYRMRFELSLEDNGLRVIRISLRMKGKTVLRTLKLQKSDPLLIKQ